MQHIFLNILSFALAHSLSFNFNGRGCLNWKHTNKNTMKKPKQGNYKKGK